LFSSQECPRSSLTIGDSSRLLSGPLGVIQRLLNLVRRSRPYAAPPSSTTLPPRTFWPSFFMTRSQPLPVCCRESPRFLLDARIRLYDFTLRFDRAPPFPTTPPFTGACSSRTSIFVFCRDCRPPRASHFCKSSVAPASLSRSRACDFSCKEVAFQTLPPLSFRLSSSS